MRCITGAIVQLANPPRSHEGVVLPTRHSWWSHKATVGRSEEKRKECARVWSWALLDRRAGSPRKSLGDLRIFEKKGAVLLPERA